MYAPYVSVLCLIPATLAGLVVKRNAELEDDTILCVSDTDESTGFCATESECSDQEGRSIGTCSRGVCCKVEQSCARSSSLPVSYFTNPAYPDTDLLDVSCNLNIRVRKNVCQVRLDFVDFELPAPGPDGRCDSNNNFKLYGPYNPKGLLGGDEQNGLCGLNQGQHLYVQVDPGNIVQLHFTLSGTGTIPNSLITSLTSQASYKWNLKITQIECGGDNEAMKMLEAPTGCLQYFQDSYGTISSFNLDGTSLFAPSQDYYVCLGLDPEDSRNACGVELRAQTFGLPVGPTDGALVENLNGDGQIPECQLGTVLINSLDPEKLMQCCVAPGSASIAMVAQDTNPPEQLRYHYCGIRLGPSNQVVSIPQPYMLNVRSPSWDHNRDVSSNAYAVGFQLIYKTLTGSC